MDYLPVHERLSLINSEHRRAAARSLLIAGLPAKPSALGRLRTMITALVRPLRHRVPKPPVGWIAWPDGHPTHRRPMGRRLRHRSPSVSEGRRR